LSRSQLLTNRLKAELELNILQAIRMVTAGWNSITCATIRNSFRKQSSLVIKTIRKMRLGWMT